MKNDCHSVLMYHAIVDSRGGVPDDRENGAHLYDVPVLSFEGQMKILAEKGCVSNLRGDWPDPGKAVLTFDDGELNNYLNAWPILQQYNLRAYFFITAYRVGHKGYMGWDQLTDLMAQGNVVGSHGLTHRILTELTDDEITRELVESKRILQDRLQQCVDACSIPRGFYTDEIIDLARQAGYKKIFISDMRARNPFCLGRIAVKSNWDEKRFLLALNHKTPLKEIFFNGCKSVAKKSMGANRYDELRNFLMKVMP